MNDLRLLNPIHSDKIRTGLNWTPAKPADLCYRERGPRAYIPSGLRWPNKRTSGSTGSTGSSSYRTGSRITPS